MADWADITGEEGEFLEDLEKHPGWPVYLKRLRLAQASELQEWMDSEDKIHKGRYEGLTRAETLIQWMKLEPKVAQARRTKKKVALPVPDESVKPEHVALLRRKVKA